jgi:hypothetical protein
MGFASRATTDVIDRGRIVSRKQIQTLAYRYGFMALSRIFGTSILEILPLHRWSFPS